MLVRQTSQAASLIDDNDDGDGNGAGDGDGEEERWRAVEKEGRRGVSCGGPIIYAAVCVCVCVCVYVFVCN